MKRLGQRGFAHIFLVLLALVVVGVGGYFVYDRIEPESYSDDNPIQSSITNPADIKPELTYEGAYNGKLYLTGEKVGESAPWATWAKNLDRNGVATAIAYFGAESSDDISQIKEILGDFPNRLVPFYSTGVGGKEEGQLAKDGKLAAQYQSTYDAAKANGKPFMKGIGEVEIQDWPVPHNDQKVAELFRLAADRDMNVMFHIRPGQVQTAEEIIKQFKDTSFLIHLFPNDFDRERDNVISLLKNNKNVMYTIDADHLMFDTTGQNPIGLLYKYQDELDDDIDPSEASVKAAAGKFDSDFDRLEANLRTQALNRFRPLVEAVPDQVTVGTELNAAYGYEPASFDRIIKHLRFFIAGFDENIQPKLAHDNAQAVFGSGIPGITTD